MTQSVSSGSEKKNTMHVTISSSKKISGIKIYRKLAAAAMDPERPLLAQIVVTRRCNLSCGYCYEYDKVSKPVPFEDLTKRFDHLRKLKTVFVTLNGGEPLLHPQIAELVAYISKSGMIPMINSNGRLLTEELIGKLNNAGLYGMQISCDALEDNEVTKKSMKRLRPKLELLEKHAKFKVRINGVFGSTPPAEVLEVAQIVMKHGFDFQCSLMRDDHGKALPLNKEAFEAYMEIRKMRGRLPAMLNDSFQLPLVRGEDVKWKCRAGARHFEIDSQGLVHFCQPQTGSPGKPLLDFTAGDIRKNFYTEKSCTAKCPIAYAHLGSRMDFFRHQDKIAH
jgi:MoaA/NifB/PqqE/SkfB family radical SAM enzyme